MSGPAAAQGDPLLSAEVLLAPATAPAPGTPMTAATVAQFQPDPERAEQCRQAFTALGLDVGPLMGASFSVSGNRSAFERAFETAVRVDASGAVQVEGAQDGLSLPTTRLPPDVREAVQVVAFTPPPRFGSDR